MSPRDLTLQGLRNKSLEAFKKKTNQHIKYQDQTGHFQIVPGAKSAIKDGNYIFITQEIAACLFITCSISRIFILDEKA